MTNRVREVKLSKRQVKEARRPRGICLLVIHPDWESIDGSDAGTAISRPATRAESYLIAQMLETACFNYDIVIEGVRVVSYKRHDSLAMMPGETLPHIAVDLVSKRYERARAEGGALNMFETGT